MEVKDFLTTYPSYDSDFENKIFHLKEFYDEKLDPKTIEDKKGLWKHQKVMSRFLSPNTPYKSLLLVHEVGTGKTCAAFAIAEANKETMRKTIFLSPSQDLNRQQKNVLVERCFPEEYPMQKLSVSSGKNLRKSQLPYYTFTTPQSLGNMVKNISEEQIQKQYSNTVFIIDEVHKIKPHENLSRKKEELEKLMSERKALQKSSILDRKAIGKLSVNILNLQKQTVQTYTQLQRIFTLARNIKIVLLTGTPMIDKASEIVGVLNLILPSQKKLDINDWKDENKLISAIRGRVSFLKAPEVSTKKIFEKEYYSFYDNNNEIPSKLKEFVNSININIVTCIMSEVQTKTYLEEWCGAIFKSQKNTWVEDVPKVCDNITPPKKQNTLAYGSEQVTLLLIGDKGEIPTDSTTNIFGTKIKYIKGKSEFVSKFFSNIKKQAKHDKISFSEALYPYAPKYALTVKNLENAYTNGKKVFIYIRSVTGGGANALKLLVESLGYTDATYNKTHGVNRQGKVIVQKVALKELPHTKRKRFIFLTGDTTIDKAFVIDKYNNPKNAHGEYIQLIIGTDTITQGFSIKDVQEMHVHDPPWNYPTLEQAIGRIIRRDSHLVINDLLEKENKKPVEVQIYLYAAVPNMNTGVGKSFREEQIRIYKDSDNYENALTYWNSIDLKKYSRMSRKDKEIKKVERLLRENAFDCGLFYNRNVRKNENDGSRGCEYKTCEYKCVGIDMKEIIDDNHIVLSDDNYNILYSHKDVKNIKDVMVKKYFPYKEYSMLSFGKIQEIFKKDKYSEIILLKALNEIIEEDGLLKDKFGVELFLREKNNMYYTTRIQDLKFPGNFSRVLLTQNTTDKYPDQVGNSITKKIFCYGKKNKIKISKLLEFETPLIKELIVENSIVALEQDEENTLAKLVILSKTVEPSLITTSHKVITSIIIPECSRTLDLPLNDTNKESEMFCGKKVSWSPPYWKDKGEDTNKFIDDDIKNLLRFAIEKRVKFIGVGQNDKFTILKIDVIYPLKNGIRDMLGVASIDNLPRKTNNIDIDMRSVPSGRKVNSLPAKEIKKLLNELDINYKKLNKQGDLSRLLEKSLKEKKLWIEKTTADLADRAKKDVINLYKEVVR